MHVIRSAPILLLAAVSLLGACASTPDSPEVEIAPGDYARAFDAARVIVIDHRFSIDRVDAAAGVIASDAKQSSGLFTPWDTEQATFSQELEDSMNFQQRRVRVTFEPRAGEGERAERPFDLREHGEPLVCRFEVAVERIERPGRRVPTRAVRRGTQTVDPELRARGMWPAYAVTTTLDPYLAGELAAELRRSLGATGEAPAEPGG